MLFSFVVVPNETTILLAWSIADEPEIDYFAILNSQDGKQWSVIARVSVRGNGKSLETYTYEHGKPVKGENFYRLMMVDREESFTYSAVRSLVFKDEDMVSFYPNPIIDTLTIKAPDWKAIKKLTITNVVGVKVKEFNERQLQELTDMIINFKDFPGGIYLISVTHQDGMMQMEKVVKK